MVTHREIALITICLILFSSLLVVGFAYNSELQRNNNQTPDTTVKPQQQNPTPSPRPTATPTATPQTTINPSPTPQASSLIALEELAQHYANYSRSALYDMKKYNDLYNKYLNDFGPDASYTRESLDQYNQAKLREADNLWFIDGDINNYVLAGTITHDQGVWLKDRVRELRVPSNP